MEERLCRLCKKRPVIGRFDISAIASVSEEKFDTWGSGIEGTVFETCISCTLTSIKESDILDKLVKGIAKPFMRVSAEIEDEDPNPEPVNFGE